MTGMTFNQWAVLVVYGLVFVAGLALVGYLKWSGK